MDCQSICFNNGAVGFIRELILSVYIYPDGVGGAIRAVCSTPAPERQWPTLLETTVRHGMRSYSTRFATH